jgi:hypothetical protein
LNLVALVAAFAALKPIVDRLQAGRDA